MNVVLINGARFTLSARLLRDYVPPAPGKIRGATPFLHNFVQSGCYTFPLRQRSMRLLGLYALQQRIAGQYNSYFEPLAGCGLTAKLLAPRHGGVYLNEKDVLCRRALQVNFPRAEVYGYNAEDAVLYETVEETDLTFLDFNNFTLYKFVHNIYTNMMKHAFKISSKFVLVNDCTMMALNMPGGFPRNGNFLNEIITNRAEFFVALRTYYAREIPGWWLTDIAHSHANSYILFRREPLPLSICSYRASDIDKIKVIQKVTL